MKSRSLGVRSKLTLTAIFLITILYVLLGAAVQYVARTAILDSVDSTLKDMGETFAHSHEHPPGPPGVPGDFNRDHPQHPDPSERFPPERFPIDRDRADRDPRGQGGPPMVDFRPPGDPPRFDHPANSPRNPPRSAEEINIHETRPQLVWRSRELRMPMPLAQATDVDAVLDARRGLTRLQTITYKDEPVRVITVPLRDAKDHRVVGVLQINYWLGDIYKTLASLGETLLLILPVGILIMAAASTFVVGKTLQPIRDMTGAAARINAEELSGRLEVVGNDEFSELASTMNGMFGRLEKSFQAQTVALEQLKEVLLQQRRFTADASHELKTPLSVVKVNASLLKAFLENDPDGLESVEAIDHAVNRMSKLIQDLLLLARTDAGQLAEQFGDVDLITTADQSAGLVPCAKRIRISAPSEPIVVQGSQFAIERLLTNILDNACRHSPPGSPVELKITRTGGWAVIEIKDQGEGIPADHLPKIFDRFHRVDGSRHSGTGGAGLGLAICKGVVEAHRGRISVESQLDKGTTFKIELPL